MTARPDNNPLVKKSVGFAIKIVNLVGGFPKTPAGFAIGNQLVRSGTSIGANLQEAQRARSKKDFLNCLHISLKESSESRYWLFIATKSGLMIKDAELYDDVEQIIKMLFSAIKKLKSDN